MICCHLFWKKLAHSLFVQNADILSWPKETRHLLSRMSWLLEQLETSLKKKNKQINLQPKIYKMSILNCLEVASKKRKVVIFRNGKKLWKKK